MKSIFTSHGTNLWISARETTIWATRPGMTWPCSTLAGHSLRVEFNRHGDIMDLAVDGSSVSKIARNVPSDELDAITSDHLEKVHGPLHPAVRPRLYGRRRLNSI